MRSYLLILSTILFFIACKQQKDTVKVETKSSSTFHEEKESSEREVKKPFKKMASDLDLVDQFVGTYVSDGYPNGFYVKVNISIQDKGILDVVIDSHNPTSNESCSFNQAGTVISGKLFLNGVWNDERVAYTMRLVGDDYLAFSTMIQQNTPALREFCTGGLSLLGNYKRLK